MVSCTKTSDVQSDNGNKSKQHTAQFLMGIAVLGFSIGLVYYPALQGPFIFDDSSTIVDNLSIRQLWPLFGDGEKTAPLSPPSATAVYARPLVNLSFAINYSFGKLDPRGYRATHLALHFLSALLLWFLVVRTLRLEYFRGTYDSVAEVLSFAVALVWALHPLVTECVVYITQRTELMMGFFYLATLYCSLRYWSAERSLARRFFLILATLACISGMFCKEMIASAPAMVLLFERTFVAGSFRRAFRRSWPLYVGLALAWIPAIGLNYYGPRTPMTGFGMGVTAQEWWYTQTKVFFLYLQLAIWPWPLVIHYEFPYLKTLSEAWPWLLAAGLFVSGTIALLWRNRAAGFVMAWVLAVLSPTLVIPLVGETVAERRMYVPLAALVSLFVVGGYALLNMAWQAFGRGGIRSSESEGPKKIAAFAAIGLSVGFGMLSAQRLVAYQTEQSLWQDAVVHQPNDPFVRANLGISLTKTGQIREAIPHFEVWVRLRPDSHWAHYNLARSLEGTGRPEEAMKHYRLTLKHQPDHAASHYNLARLLENNREWLEARKHYRQAIEVQPDFSAAYTNLGLLAYHLGDMQEAVEHFESALGIQTDLGNYVNLLLALMQTNRSTDAIEVAERAIVLARSQKDTGMVVELETILASLRPRQATP